jgi:hypothetical protein
MPKKIYYYAFPQSHTLALVYYMPLPPERPRKHTIMLFSCPTPSLSHYYFLSPSRMAKKTYFVYFSTVPYFKMTKII